MFITSEAKKIQESELICAVKILEIRADRPQQVVLTRAKVQPIECFKGQAKTPLEVVWPGGVDSEGHQTRVIGTPNLKVGEEVILFLWRKSAGYPFGIHSWTAGIIPIYWNKITQRYELKNRPPLPGSLKKENKKEEGETFDDFRKRVKSALAKEAKNEEGNSKHHKK